MMIRSELVSILVCPEDHSPLTLADPALVERLNRAIAQGQLKNKAGQKLEKPLDGGLLRADRSRLYPIVDDIPMMLLDEAILLDQAALTG